jgi:hypothetical protein
MTYRFLFFIVFLTLTTNPLPTFAQTTSSESSEANPPAHVNTNNTIVVHKPATDPAWGKVIQFQQEQSISASERTKETLYKFLFQDSHGVVRSAIYHEGSSGTGYWEVTVWDQP